MSDEADRADDRIDAAITEGIDHARYMLAKIKLAACNSCHYCGEYVRDGHIFCDRLCAADWEYEQQRKKAHGRK